ncbi:hydrogenase maturation nickel metallochaperone HypA [Actinoplanes sichuanensis]|uniref:Hydrogenase maturation factor HypA n=1 Tax=Actinoplanes sichuanensis TaxID=512349 RepID=A0ABW4A597_9ACTN|nr:hydrogenase maturation nickel metallochaperone HypA [Actinoplanes sichuanensis]BEL03058.1 hydrogenase maturation nickel metallochaperone HypA [Actinoplanes sichuanensis]
MHELAIAENIVDTVCSRAAGRPVRRVTLRIGALTAVLPDHIRFCFELAAAGTAAHGAALDLDLRPAVVFCRSCQVEQRLPDLIPLCPCGSADVTVTTGRELDIVSMEVA